MVDNLAAAQTGTEDHHGSHRDLLWAPDEPSIYSADLDAIIVPTVRHPSFLLHAAEIATSLGCRLVTLHSGRYTSAGEAARMLPAKTDLVAINMPTRTSMRLPRLRTSRLLAGTRFARRSDLSAKRNLALAVCHMTGWERVLFLDDDIKICDESHVTRAAGLLDTHSAVGFFIDGFPDHSVVCHAYLRAGGPQQSFIGGGALAVHVTRNRSFFPDIYNDDWFYLLDAKKGLQPVATTGRVIQTKYDPFRNPERARAEELGDVLAEGAFWLLDQKRSLVEADLSHWEEFLDRRGRFIGHVLDLVEQSGIETGEKARMIAALKASTGRLAHIKPELCRDYLQACAADRELWCSHLDRLPVKQSPREALAYLGLRKDQIDVVVRHD